NDEDDFIPLRDIIARYSPSVAITSSPPILPTREPEDSLLMGDEHLNTSPETESDEIIKSSVENLVLIPSESEDFSDNESECDMPVCDDFTTFSNPLFDYDDDFSSNDDESFSDEDVPNENFKIYSNPLFDEEIISSKIKPHHFNVESDLIESLLNRDILTVSYPKIDSLLEEFSCELAHIDLIPQGIVDTDFDPKEEIHLIEELLYDNSSPRSPEESNSKISNATIESLSLHLLSLLRIVTLLWRRSTYFLLQMIQYHRVLKVTMTRKGIFFYLKNCLTMTLFPLLSIIILPLTLSQIRP
ncbi:hypothetical protein Tco_0041982, partial [Tanacetum coccineum]